MNLAELSRDILPSKLKYFSSRFPKFKNCRTSYLSCYFVFNYRCSFHFSIMFSKISTHFSYGSNNF